MTKFIGIINNKEHIIEYNNNIHNKLHQSNITINKKKYNIYLISIINNIMSIMINNKYYKFDIQYQYDNNSTLYNNININFNNYTTTIKLYNEKYKYIIDNPNEKTNAKEYTTIKSEMPGKIIKIFVKNNQIIKQNQKLFIIETMKMENEIKSPTNGIIQSINIIPQQTINANDILITIK